MKPSALSIHSIMLANQIIILNVLKVTSSGGMMVGTDKIENQIQASTKLFKKIDELIIKDKKDDTSSN